MPHVAKHISNLRKRTKISQEKLGQKLGDLSQSFVSNMETTNPTFFRPPSLIHMRRICRLCQASDKEELQAYRLLALDSDEARHVCQAIKSFKPANDKEELAAWRAAVGEPEKSGTSERAVA